MSETSTPYTPASASTTVAGNETVSLADEVKKYKTKELIDFLSKEEDLELEEEDLEIIRKQRVNGRTFFKITKEELERHGMKLGPATALVDFAKECKEKKLRAFSSYRSLKEVLEKYNLASEGTEIIPLFTPRIHEIPDENKHLELCMADIKLRLKSYGTLVITSLESMRNEYVSTILHTALRIAEDATNKKFSMRPEYEIIGDESSGRVDYAIKESDELICITEDKVQQKLTEGFAQNIKQLESSFQTNKRKRKRDEDYFDYLYGVVTSARDWHFLLYSPGEILQASKAPLIVRMMNEILGYIFSLLSGLPASSNLISLLHKIPAGGASTNARIEDAMGNVFNGMELKAGSTKPSADETNATVATTIQVDSENPTPVDDNNDPPKVIEEHSDHEDMDNVGGEDEAEVQVNPDTSSKERANTSTDKPSGKKAKTKVEDSRALKNLIREHS